ncbi:MAG: CDP-glucose 4,6-dehydratase [Candidatus Eremiobacteraeota bacterium]|nr:CDP-glucose 4,6-dehydratase [Candidatus Eremiobacteraeota bacterium]
MDRTPGQSAARDFWNGRRVFLTGHTGFKGSWLALRLLALGARVWGYALPPDDGPNAFDVLRLADEVDSTLGDVRDAAALANAMRRAQPEVVIHLAAQALVRRGYRQPLDTFETNVIGTAHVLDAVRMRTAPGVGLVLVVTSDKVYATGQQRPMREGDPLGGDDPYSASKACAELVVAGYRRLLGGGARLATARAGNVIGGGDWAEDRLVPDMVRAAAQGTALHLRYPHAVRPWQHVADVVNGYLRLVEALAGDAQRERAWNFGPPAGSDATVLTLAERFLSAYAPETRIEVDEAAPLEEAAFLALDAGDARRVLGWAPRYDLDRLIQTTAEWYDAWRRGATASLRDLTVAQLRPAGEAIAAS